MVDFPQLNRFQRGNPGSCRNFKTMEKSPFSMVAIRIAEKKTLKIWLVVSTNPSEKWWSSSVGMMIFPIYGKIKFMFQTTNQIQLVVWTIPLLICCLWWIRLAVIAFSGLCLHPPVRPDPSPCRSNLAPIKSVAFGNKKCQQHIEKYSNRGFLAFFGKTPNGTCVIATPKKMQICHSKTMVTLKNQALARSFWALL